MDVSVGELLTLGVLMENGGVLVKNYDTVFRGDLKWIEDAF